MQWPLQRVAVVEQSMEPALHPGDWLLVWRGIRAGEPPRVRSGDVVIAAHPERTGFLLVKRATMLRPAGWWLESDNTSAVGAVDSWSFGPVSGELIYGKVLLRYWPLRRD